MKKKNKTTPRIPCSLDAIISYFSAKFWTLLCPLSEDNRVRCGATGRSVPLKCLKRTGCLTAPLLIYPCCLFNQVQIYLYFNESVWFESVYRYLLAVCKMFVRLYVACLSSVLLFHV